MQTLARQANRWLTWEMVDLPNGVFRIQNARWLDTEPDVKGWVDCRGTQQMNEEVEIALEMLGEKMTGEWVAAGKIVAGVCHGVAWTA